MIYALVAALWIVFSDQAIEWVFSGSAPVWAQSTKGLFYVVATSGLLYLLIGRFARELSLAEGELRQILESIPDAVIVADDRGRILEANRAAALLLGPQISHGVGSWAAQRGRLQLPGGQPVSQADDAVAAALNGTVTVGWQTALVSEGRDPVHLSVSAAPVHELGEVRLAVAVLRDVTDLRRLERMRDEFLSTAAHELKTPIAAIKGYVQLLRRWAPEGHEPREKAAFEVLNRQCDRITRLIQELLEVSRLQLGEVQLHRESFDLGEVTAGVIERTQALTARHRLSLIERPAAVPVEADRDRVEQVLLNLLDNAIKFSPPGARIDTSVAVQDGEARVSVHDPGVGIPAERREHLFEPFYLAHAGTLYQHQGGIGIGLYISRNIVQRHGGRIWCESQEGQGSTFHFSLPLAVGGAHDRHE